VSSSSIMPGVIRLKWATLGFIKISPSYQKQYAYKSTIALPFTEARR